MYIYSCAPTLGQISLKNSFGKVFFSFLIIFFFKIEMPWNENWLFGHHFETVQHFIVFSFYLFILFFFMFLLLLLSFQNWYILIVHAYMVQISLQTSSGKVVFLRGKVP